MDIDNQNTVKIGVGGIRGCSFRIQYQISENIMAANWSLTTVYCNFFSLIDYLEDGLGLVGPAILLF